MMLPPIDWRRSVLLALALALVGVGCRHGTPLPTAPEVIDPGYRTQDEFLEAHGLTYWLTVQEEPRPLRWHNVRVDLRNPRSQVIAVVNDDPDGEGPAEAALRSPLDMAASAGSIAFINTNAFGGLPDPNGKRPTGWHVGMPVEIIGLAARGGAIRSEAKPEAYAPLWLDRNGGAHLGNPDDLSHVSEGVAGFGWILRQNTIIPRQDEVRHPRTAVGLDQSGRWLFLVVVDGRQSGFSEGVSTNELGAHMKQIGCVEALNLDGGGSSIMLLGDAAGFLRIVNSPSSKVFGKSVPRPLPVGLAVRPRR